MFPNTSHRSIYSWIAIGVVCLIIRSIASIAYFQSLDGDPDAYRSLAIGIAEHHVFGRYQPAFASAIPTAYRPPLYPWLLSFLVDRSDATLPSSRVAIAHIILGTFTCVISAWIAERLSLLVLTIKDGPSAVEGSRFHGWVGWIAGLLVACDPILLRQSTLVMTETLATALSVCILAIALQWTIAFEKQHIVTLGALGIAFGVATLCRPTSVAWMFLFLAIYMATGILQRSIRTIAKRSGWIIAGAVLVIGPWVARNQIQFHQPLLTSHSGYTLYLANNPILYKHIEQSWSRTWDEDRFHRDWRERLSQLPAQSEVAVNQLATDSAMETIRNHPLIFLKSCLVRMVWFWAALPDERQAGPWLRMAIGAWYISLHSLALLGAIWTSRRWSIASPSMFGIVALTLLLHLCTVHLLYWSNMRMRAPAVPLIAIFASFATMELANRIAGYRHR